MAPKLHRLSLEERPPLGITEKHLYEGRGTVDDCYASVTIKAHSSGILSY